MSERNAQSLCDLLRLRAQMHPDRLAYAFVREGIVAEALTFGELHQRSLAISRLVRDRSDGGRVLLVFPSGLEYIIAFFACLYAGAVPVPVYPPRGNRPDSRLAAIAEDSQASLALTTSKILIDGEPDDLFGRLKIEWLASDDYESDLNGMAEPEASGFSCADSLAYLQYTSGSTSQPKGVMVSHRSLMSTLEDLDRGWKHNSDSVMVTWLPLFHDMGLIYGVLVPLYKGFRCYLLEPAAFLQRPARWLEALSTFRGTHSAAPNFAYDLCVDAVSEDDKSRLDLSSWRMVLNAAEPVRSESMRRFTAAFMPCGFSPDSFCPGYGLAEASLKVTALPLGTGYSILSVSAEELQKGRVVSVEAGSTGAKSLVGCGGSAIAAQVVIVDPITLTASPLGHVGEVWVASNSVAAGYWNRPEESERTFQARLTSNGDGPFLRTGDLGFLQDGQLYITGRLKDLIIIRGTNHYPQDIELTVERSHDALRRGCGAAFSVDVRGEERLVVVQEVKRTEFRKLKHSEAISSIRAAIAESHALSPYAIVLLKPASLPKTTSGKVKRNACREAFLADTLPTLAEFREPLTRVDAPSESVKEALPIRSAAAIEQWLLKVLAEPLGLAPSQLDPCEPFVRFGVDSLAAVRLSGELTSLTGCSLPATLLFEHPSPRALALALAGESAVRGCQPKRTQLAAQDTVAVIGMGCRFPGAANPQAYWRLLRDGDGRPSAPPLERRFPSSVPSGYYLDRIDEFDAEFFGISPKEAANMDPQQRLLLEVAWEALENAGQAQFAGSNTGVFVGISGSDYLRMLLCDSDSPPAQSGTGGALSIAANRLSYLLDLHGPSWAVDTACSSSLVAVHQARQSLLLGECDMALAGGVNLILSSALSEAFAKAGMLSPDGRCKVFDAEADGYGRGEGCGAVVLKRHQDAIRDGDRILALLVGSAVNQDGRSNGLTAPNGSAQQEVIRKALAQAQLSASAVSYVEAHGTGTSLGDPIEINALKAVFGGARAPGQSCIVGSAKASIGHLEAAAGIAGLIKTVVMLEQQEIPAQRNLCCLNPHIDLSGLPLDVADIDRPWLASQRPRVAGVSSFGFGGTNAHVVVSDPGHISASACLPQEPAAPAILALSAKSTAALIDLARAYRTHLEQSPQSEFADICYSANVGRVPFNHRLAIVADSAAQFLDLLQRAESGVTSANLIRGEAPISREPKVAFLFTGQGSQYPGMGRELFEQFPVFREAIEECEKLLSNQMEPSLLEVLYGNGANDYLSQTQYAQPALFALEVSLARLWRSWGIEPTAVLGHSLGEYAAACVAGIFSLEDGLRLVAARGRLTQESSGDGGMAAVFASIAEVEKKLALRAPDLSVAAINGPRNTVISGPRETLAAARAAFALEGVSSKLLPTSHAFHSPHMESVATRFEAEVSSITLVEPCVTFISNLTGTVAGHEVASRIYWRRHLLEAVQFEKGMEALGELQCEVFLELGPQPVLIELGKHILGENTSFWGASLRKGRCESDIMFKSLAGTYVKGARVNWRGVYQGQRRGFVNLPTYPFQRQPYWIGSPPPGEAGCKALLYQLAWQPSAGWHIHAAFPRSMVSKCWLIFADGSELCEQLAEQLEASGQICWRIYRQAPANIRGASRTLVLDLAQVDAVDQLIEEFGASLTSPIAGVVYLWTLSECRSDELLVDSMDKLALLTCDVVVNIAQSLDRLPSPARLWLVTRGLASVDVCDGKAPPIQALLLGTGKVVASEFPRSWGCVVDLAPVPKDDDLSAIVSELQENGGELQVAWRDGQRFVGRLVAIQRTPKANFRFAQHATYLITGGLGALGLQTAEWMVRRGARHLVLVGRRGASGRDGEALRALRECGASVNVLRLDISQPESVAGLFAQIAELGPELKGIVHAAGVGQSAMIKDMVSGQHGAVWGPKVMGAWLLHRHTAGMNLDFFVCYSSIASVLGAHGQARYAAANQFLDELATYRRSLGLPAISINWGPWAGEGMATKEYRAQLARFGIREIQPADAFEALEQCLITKAPRIVIADIDWALYNTHFPTQLLDELVRELPAVKSSPQEATLRQSLLMTSRTSERRRQLMDALRGELAHVLGFAKTKQIDPLQGFFDLGMDSLAALELNRRLELLLGTRLPKTLAFEAPHLASLADRLDTLVFKDSGAVESTPVPDASEVSEEDTICALSEQELELYVDHELQRTLQ